MKHASTNSPRAGLFLGFLLVTACTTGTDVTDATPAAEDRARLDRIALIAHRMIADARLRPGEPASALVEDLARIAQEAEATDDVAAGQ